MKNIILIIPLAINCVSPACKDHPKGMNEFAPSEEPEWNHCATYEDVVRDYPDQVKFLLGRIDLQNPGLARVKTALEEKDTSKACAELITYFKTSQAGESYRKSAGAYANSTFENVLVDILPASGDWCAHTDKHQPFDTSGKAGPMLDAGIRMKSKVLPIAFYSIYVKEGVQKELAQGYHKIVIKDYEEFWALFAKMGVEPDPLLNPIIQKGWEHLALTCKPNGHSLMLNDENDASHEKDVVSRAEIYDRPDWLYPFSNGREGAEPNTGPSIMYVWSGRMG
jgi:hypothetical protein